VKSNRHPLQLSPQILHLAFQVLRLRVEFSGLAFLHTAGITCGKFGYAPGAAGLFARRKRFLPKLDHCQMFTVHGSLQFEV
jgi:hypothetical protein